MSILLWLLSVIPPVLGVYYFGCCPLYRLCYEYTTLVVVRYTACSMSILLWLLSVIPPVLEEYTTLVVVRYTACAMSILL